MDKILGEVFDDYVQKQIEVRQRSLGKTQKDVDDLQVFNASTPWIRLSSPIFIDPQKTKELANSLDIDSTDIEGFNLAKNLVLFAGVSKGDNLQNRIGGVGIQNKLDNAYGFLSDKEQGYKPMPGVTGMTTTYKNNGSLKQAQVNITCFTRKQFEALEALYLRLGYTVVLEWGHSVYFDNQGVKQNMSSLSIPNKLFSSEEDLKPKPIQDSILKNKKETGGNYDGIVAKVSNFSWNLNNDLSYSITLDLISVGDIIDSLKMNVGTTGNLTQQDAAKVNVQTAAGIQNITTIELDKNTSKLNTLLYELVQELTTKEVQKEYSQTTQDILTFKDAAIAAVPYIPKIREAYINAIEGLIEKNVTTFYKIREVLKNNNVFQIDSLNEFGQVKSARFDFTNSPIKEDEFNSLLASLGYTDEEQSTYKFVRLNTDTGKYEIPPSFPYPRFLEEFGLKFQSNAPSTNPKYLIVDRTKNDQAQLGAFRGSKVMKLEEALNRVKEYFQGLNPIKVGDPEKDNIEEIIWLGNRLRDNIPALAIKDLLETGYFDKKGKKYEHQNLKVDNVVFDIIR